MLYSSPVIQGVIFNIVSTWFPQEWKLMWTGCVLSATFHTLSSLLITLPGQFIQLCRRAKVQLLKLPWKQVSRKRGNPTTSLIKGHQRITGIHPSAASIQELLRRLLFKQVLLQYFLLWKINSVYYNTPNTSMSLCLLKNIFSRHTRKEQQHILVMIWHHLLDDLTFQCIC